MSELEFLQSNIFNGLTNLNPSAQSDTEFQFSTEDFKMVLERAAHFGLGIYSITTWLNDESYGTSLHGDHNKKATDPRWYEKAYLTFTHREASLVYAAHYKVSGKLLARFTVTTKEEE